MASFARLCLHLLSFVSTKMRDSYVCEHIGTSNLLQYYRTGSWVRFPKKDENIWLVRASYFFTIMTKPYIAYLASSYGIPYDNFMSYMFYGIVNDHVDIGRFILYYNDKKSDLERNIAEMSEVQEFRRVHNTADNLSLSASWGNLKNLEAKNTRLKRINQILDDLFERRRNIDKFISMSKKIN